MCMWAVVRCENGAATLCGTERSPYKAQADRTESNSVPSRWELCMHIKHALELVRAWQATHRAVRSMCNARTCRSAQVHAVLCKPPLLALHVSIKARHKLPGKLAKRILKRSLANKL